MTWVIILLAVYVIIGLVTFAGTYRRNHFWEAFFNGVFWPVHIIGELLD